MTSGWEIYYVVFLFAGLSLGVPLTLALLSRTRRQRGAAPSVVTSQMGARTNARFFLSAMLSLPMIGLALILIPCVGVLASRDRENDALAAFGVLSLGGLALLAVSYAAKKGDLDWLRSYRERR